MNIEHILVIIVSITFLIFILHFILKEKNGKIANFINKIWDEWFEKQWLGILAFLLLIVIAAVLGLMLR